MVIFHWLSAGDGTILLLNFPLQPPSNAAPWPHLRVERKATATSLQAGSSAQHVCGTSSCPAGQWDH